MYYIIVEIKSLTLFIHIGNRRLWTITLKSQIFDSTGSNSIPVLLASDKEACEDLCKLLRQLFKSVAIQALETETVIELKCLSFPTREYIENGAFPDVLHKILLRDPLWKIFPPSSISKFLLIATAVVENLGKTVFFMFLFLKKPEKD